MEIGTIISLGSVAVSASKFAFDVISHIRKRNKKDRTEDILREFERLNTHVEKLSDSIWYAPDVYAVRQTQVPVQPRVTDLREVRLALEPVHHLTPDMMRQAMSKHPWDVLLNIRPLVLSRPHPDPEMVPLLFEFDRGRYVGWQKPGILPVLFKCEYEPGAWDGTYVPQVSAHTVPRRAELVDFDWVTVSAGEFLMGSEKQCDLQAYDDESRCSRFLAVQNAPVCEPTGTGEYDQGLCSTRIRPYGRAGIAPPLPLGATMSRQESILLASIQLYVLIFDASLHVSDGPGCQPVSCAPLSALVMMCQIMSDFASV